MGQPCASCVCPAAACVRRTAWGRTCMLEEAWLQLGGGVRLFSGGWGSSSVGRRKYTWLVSLHVKNQMESKLHGVPQVCHQRRRRCESTGEV